MFVINSSLPSELKPSIDIVFFYVERCVDDCLLDVAVVSRNLRLIACVPTLCGAVTCVLRRNRWSTSYKEIPLLLTRGENECPQMLVRF
jgi:hypothetical protein